LLGGRRRLEIWRVPGIGSGGLLGVPLFRLPSQAARSVFKRTGDSLVGCHKTAGKDDEKHGDREIYSHESKRDELSEEFHKVDCVELSWSGALRLTLKVSHVAGWRGACASTIRDSRWRWLSRLVRLLHLRTVNSISRLSAKLTRR
jgi:hypothetical protein